MGYYNDNDNNKIRCKKISNNKDSNKKFKYFYILVNKKNKSFNISFSKRMSEKVDL